MKTPRESAYKDIIPKEIRLPDGRRVLVKDILVRAENRVNYNLRTGSQKKVGRRVGGRPTRYTIEDRQWCAQATIEEIAEKFNITLKQADQIRFASRYVLAKLEIDLPDNE